MVLGVVFCVADTLDRLTAQGVDEKAGFLIGKVMLCLYEHCIAKQIGSFGSFCENRHAIFLAEGNFR